MLPCVTTITAKNDSPPLAFDPWECGCLLMLAGRLDQGIRSARPARISFRSALLTG